MSSCLKSFARQFLISTAFVGLGPAACVDTQGTAKRPSDTPTQSSGGQAAGGGTSSDAGGGCQGVIDTNMDGTAGTPAAGPYTWKSVTIRAGGFVDGIIFSRVQQDLVYARTDMGGAYRWDASANGWVPLTDWVSQQHANWTGIESIAADPVDANVVYMAAGTYMSSGDTAILRSADGGVTFTPYTIGVPMGGNVEGRSMGERLAIDPNLTSTLYFASRGDGLRKSIDSGATWTQVTSFPVKGGTTYSGNKLGLSFVLFDPNSGTPGSGSSTIYVGVADITEGSNLYVTQDSGSTWQLIPGGPSQWTPNRATFDSSGMLYLAFDYGVHSVTTNGTTANYPIGLAGPDHFKSGGVWKYDPSSSSWTDISPPSGQVGYGGVTTDASHPGTVIVSTLDWWAPDKIFRTTDGGSHWSDIGSAPARHNPNGAAWLWFGKDCSNAANLSVTGWMADIEIDPFDAAHVLYVTGQGVWSSHNANSETLSDILWTFEDRNLEQTAINADMVSSVNGAFLSCVGDIAGMRNENLDQPSPLGMYQNPTFGNCSSLDFAALDPNIVVRAGSPSSANKGQYGGYSKDNGKTWSPFAATPVPSGATASGGRLAVSADGKSILWALRYSINGTNPSVLDFSLDDGGTWTQVSGLAAASSIAADRTNPNKFYAYSYDNTSRTGTVYASTDAGRTFSAQQNTLAFASSGSLRVPFGVEGDVWLVANSKLHRSTESGANFALVASVQAANSVGFGKAAPGNSYPAVYLLGTVDSVPGFFRSDDQGVSWTRINDDQHQFATATYVAGDEGKYGRIYVGNNGRGIIYGESN
jgi:hypothetical protein